MTEGLDCVTELLSILRDATVAPAILAAVVALMKRTIEPSLTSRTEHPCSGILEDVKAGLDRTNAVRRRSEGRTTRGIIEASSPRKPPA